MMSFRVINQAIIALLGNSAAGRFTVTGYERQSKDASEVQGSKRNVQSFYSHGDFPKSRGRANSATQHEMTFTLGLSVSAAAKCNLSAINSPTATPAQIAQALDGIQEAGYVADVLMDELFEVVYQILMDARNIDLGLPPGTVTQRWVSALDKNPPLPQGSLLMLSGSVTFTCSADEQVLGDVGVPLTDGVGVTFDISGDVIQQTGVDTRPSVDQTGALTDGSGATLVDFVTGEDLTE